MFKLKIIWMLLVIKLLYHILCIVDELQDPYKRRGESTLDLYREHYKLVKQLEKELK